MCGLAAARRDATEKLLELGLVGENASGEVALPLPWGDSPDWLLRSSTLALRQEVTMGVWKDCIDPVCLKEFGMLTFLDAFDMLPLVDWGRLLGGCISEKFSVKGGKAGRRANAGVSREAGGDAIDVPDSGCGGATFAEVVLKGKADALRAAAIADGAIAAD
jgi:hypothetical protein